MTIIKTKLHKNYYQNPITCKPSTVHVRSYKFTYIFTEIVSGNKPSAVACIYQYHTIVHVHVSIEMLRNLIQTLSLKTEFIFLQIKRQIDCQAILLLVFIHYHSSLRSSICSSLPTRLSGKQNVLPFGYNCEELNIYSVEKDEGN